MEKDDETSEISKEGAVMLIEFEILLHVRVCSLFDYSKRGKKEARRKEPPKKHLAGNTL